MVYHSKLYFWEVAMVTPFKTWLSHLPWENITLFYTLHFNLKLYCSSFPPRYNTSGSLVCSQLFFCSKFNPEFPRVSQLGLETPSLSGQDSDSDSVVQCASDSDSKLRTLKTLNHVEVRLTLLANSWK